MREITPFKFRRTKGIVWVCDIEKSSSFLNNDDSADDIEQYIPRLYYISKALVESFGGIYIKWTGDGFLAFFEFELDRNKQTEATKVFTAAYHLSFINNITQLGLGPEKRFKIRHGITYEKDALLMQISETEKNNSWDIIGRSVVLAFRLSGIKANFPGIVTTKEIVTQSDIIFERWIPSPEEKLKFFKGEKFGTDGIWTSPEKTYKGKPNANVANKKLNKIVQEVESDSPSKNIYLDKFLVYLQNGPDWCQEIYKQEIEFVGQMYTMLKKITLDR